MADNFRIGGRNLKNKLIEKFNGEYGERIAAANFKVEILRFATPEYKKPLTSKQKQKIFQYTAWFKKGSLRVTGRDKSDHHCHDDLNEN
jgi:CRISPR/Cas system endoribonuclease Cas6 (RAMP superfamily)